MKGDDHHDAALKGTVVIKVGTSSLIRPEHNTLNLTSLASIVETIRDIKNNGYNVILVSSGAVGVGCQRLNLTTRPSDLPRKQALAAVGQVRLLRSYDDLFSTCGLVCSQVLLTLDNIANRGQFLNATNTFKALLEYGIIPIVNENDTVAVEQLRIGDNDTLSAQVATLVQADWLFLLTDVDALYTANPSTDPTAKPIREVPDLWSLEVDTSTKGTQWGTGGMATKLTAARMATASGCNMAICHYAEPRHILSILHGDKSVGTVFYAAPVPLRGRKRWVLNVPTKGELWLDPGAVRAVRDRQCSLFSVGIVKVIGTFHPQDAVKICDDHGKEFARGLINYSNDDVEAAKGMSSKLFLQSLGGAHGQEEIMHRANICLLARRRGGLLCEGDGHVDEVRGGGGGEVDEEEHDSGDEMFGGGMSPAGLSRSTTPALVRGERGVRDGGSIEEQAMAARLAVLMQRVSEEEEVDWKAAAVEAARYEAQQEILASSAGNGGEDKEI